jgi:uncharacterized ion transporter superfamily protein YfcC
MVMIMIVHLFVIRSTLGTIVFLGILLVSQKLGVHTSLGHKLASLGLFDAIGMRLLRVVVRASVLGLSWFERRIENRGEKESYISKESRIYQKSQAYKRHNQRNRKSQTQQM